MKPLTPTQLRALRDLAEPGIQPRSVLTGFRLEDHGLVTHASHLTRLRIDRRTGDVLTHFEPWFEITPKGWEKLGIRQ